MRPSDDRPIAALANGANAYCLDDGTLCFGMGLERLLLNIEILEKCAESYVLANVLPNQSGAFPGSSGSSPVVA